MRLLGHIPRNYNYGDGLRIIYPKLQERFGDKNVDMAVGVLYELIEVESPPPFPEAVYQRWKYEHMHRHVSSSTPRTICTAPSPVALAPFSNHSPQTRDENISFHFPKR